LVDLVSVSGIESHKTTCDLEVDARVSTTLAAYRQHFQGTTPIVPWQMPDMCRVRDLGR
jgi:hypothetical protein